MLFSLFVESTPCCSLQSKVALSFFPDGALWWMPKHSATSTLLMCGFPHPHVNYLCWIFLCEISSCWQNLQTAMYILNRHSTLLPVGGLRCSQLTHMLFIKCSTEKAVCHGQKVKNLVQFSEDLPTHSCLVLFVCLLFCSFKTGKWAQSPWYCI